MRPARFRRSALPGCALLGACNDTRDLAPASPDTPWQFEPPKETPTAPAPAAVGTKRFTVPENTVVQLPSPADIDPNHVYSLVGIDGERDRWPGARRIPVSQQPRTARLHRLQRPGSIPATHCKISAVRFRRARSRCR